MSYDYNYLRVNISDRIMWVTIDNPPINLITKSLFAELAKLSAAVAADDEVSVVVFESANPEFFIAHFDVEAILEYPTNGQPQRPTSLGGFHRMCEAYRTMPKATICKVAGRVGGGGSEFAASCDMRFSDPTSTLCQMEVPLGIIPGGTGTQRLPWLVGRGRALEIVLGGVDIDARTAEQWGYFNRVLPPDELDTYVRELAHRIASFPVMGMRLAKQAVLNALSNPTEALLDESLYLQQTIRDEDARAAMRRFLELGGQTREGELRMGALGAELTASAADPRPTNQ